MKNIYQGTTKTGKEINIRYPEISDLDEMLSYINELSDEKTFVRYQGEHETLESETSYLKSRLEAIKNKKAVHLLVFYKDKLIAASDVHMLDKTEKHVGVFGITVAKDFRGEGLGKLLMELILKEAENEILGLKIVTLEVYSSNLIARKLYKKLGFIEYGRLPNGIIRGGKLEDAVLMHKNIK
jgi:ribosomal protein S18 acetylase RimI-like enzyme